MRLICCCEIFSICVNLARGFSKSWYHVFVMSNICAFVLTWCLFVGNSRQTTSSVPWHRAPKYDRKHNLHLTMKWFLFKWFLNWCMFRKRVCVASCENTVWIQGVRKMHKMNVSAQICIDKTSNQLQCTPYSVLFAWHVWLEISSWHVYRTSLRFQTVVLQDGQTLLCFVVFWFYFKTHKSNQNHAKHFFVLLFFFFYLSIWTHLANQHMMHPY